MKRINDKLVIRETSKEDIPLIYKLIRELADYEKLSDTVTADEKLLEKNMFGKNRYAYVVIAEYEGKAAGSGTLFLQFLYL